MARFILFLFLVVPAMVQAQKSTEKPKLVVGIVVDQMRQEYLYRFASKYGDGGFKRMMNDGFMLKNAHYNYVPTFTGPGHASVYTGSTPAIHGIIANDWYDKQLKKSVNCVGDDRQKPVGNEKGNGDVSPWRMLSTTVTDELKISSQMKSRVVGISIKDRAATLPAGHTPDGAYWYDGLTGHFITSTYYMQQLPDWLVKFNSQNLAAKYLSQDWNTVYPIAQYTESGPDDSPYETIRKGKDKPTFPYNLAELKKTAGFDLLVGTPFGNDLLGELAKAAIEGEGLGADDTSDFLTLSFSSTDAIGHAMGANSVELEDTYIRLDRTIQDLLSYLDKKVGAGKYTVFLTADHAVAEVSQYLIDHSIPGDYFKFNGEAAINEYLQKYFPGKKPVENVSNDQVFFNQDLFSGDPKSGGIELLIATELVNKFLMSVPGVAQVYNENVLRQADYGQQGVKGMIVRGYHHKRSGDIAYVLEPGWTAWSEKGAHHGSPYSYDTNVPILFYGVGVRKGSSVRYHPITDIAPTISVMLGIKFPNGCTGQPISEILD